MKISRVSLKQKLCGRITAIQYQSIFIHKPIREVEIVLNGGLVKHHVCE